MKTNTLYTLIIFNTTFPGLATEYGEIKGTVTYPSDVIPSQLVCAQNLTSGKQYCTSTIEDKEEFSIVLPPGQYTVFAMACNNYYGTSRANCPDGYAQEYKAYFNDFVVCGLTYDCMENISTNNPVIVEVNPGKTTTGIKPHDWYSRKSK